jgi:FixJ family two-component response regulator
VAGELRAGRDVLLYDPERQMNANRPTVCVVEDDAGVRDSLCLLLRLHGFTGKPYETGEALVADIDTLAAAGTPVVLLDLRLPGMSGAQVQSEIELRGMRWPVIMLTAHGDATSARNALKAGASDFIEKPIEESVLLGALEAALAERDALDATRTRQAEASKRFARLTTREREVLALVVAGFHNREVARELGISARTVEVYKARLMDKLGVERLPDLIRLALRMDKGNP